MLISRYMITYLIPNLLYCVFLSCQKCHTTPHHAMADYRKLKNTETRETFQNGTGKHNYIYLYMGK